MGSITRSTRQPTVPRPSGAGQPPAWVILGLCILIPGMIGIASVFALVKATASESPPGCSGTECDAPISVADWNFVPDHPDDDGCLTVCGDGICEWNECEGSWNCPTDCVACGDGVCAPSEVDSCLQDCPVAVTCGDGICSAGENPETCPQDCPDVVTATASPTPHPQGGRATATPTDTPTPIVTEEPTDEPTPETTEEPAEDLPDDDAGGGADVPEPLDVCRELEAATITPDVLLAAQSDPRYRRANDTDMQAWVTCGEEACVPIETLAGGRTDPPAVTNMFLLDCEGETCERYRVSEEREGEVCFTPGRGQNPISCAGGCLVFVDEVTSRVVTRTVTLLCIIAVMAGGVIGGMILLMVRRRKEEEEEDTEDLTTA